MATQLKILKDDKGKLLVKAQEATVELTYLMNFNHNLCYGQDNAGLICSCCLVIWPTSPLPDVLVILLSELHPSIWAHFFQILSSRKLRTNSLNMMTSITPVPHTRNRDSITPVLSLQGLHRTLAGSVVHQPGK